MELRQFAVRPLVAMTATLLLIVAVQSISSACIDGNCNDLCKINQSYCVASSRGYNYDYGFADTQCGKNSIGGNPIYSNTISRYDREETTCTADCYEDSQNFGGVGVMNLTQGYVSATTSGVTIITNCDGNL